MRNKTKQILFKVDEWEYGQIRKRMAQCGIINMNRYLRVLAVQGYIFHIDPKSINECSRLLGNISGNINQIAARANAAGSIYAADVESIKAKFLQIMFQFKDVLKELIRIFETATKLRSYIKP